MRRIIFKYVMSKQWFLELIRERFDEEMEYVQFYKHAEGCGLEDQNITDRYEAMEYGWRNGAEAVEECFYNTF